MRRTSLIILIALLLCMVSNAWAGELKLRHYFNEEWSVGIDKGSAITYWDIKKTEVLGGYTLPLLLYEVPDKVELLKDYTFSLDTGVVGNDKDFDGVIGLGSNAPKIVVQFVIDKTISPIFDKNIQIPDWTRIEYLGRADSNRLIQEGEIAISHGVALGITIPWN